MADMASMRRSALEDKGMMSKPKSMNYDVTPEELSELQDKGSVQLESGCTLTLAGEQETTDNAAEDASE